MKTDKETVKIELKLLKRIAEYYEFPLAVFFSPLSAFKGNTRRENRYAKLQRMIDEFEI